MALGWWKKIVNCNSQMVLLQRWVGLGLIFVNKSQNPSQKQILLTLDYKLFVLSVFQMVVRWF